MIPYANSQIYSLVEYLSNGLPVYAPIWPLVRAPGLLTDPAYPIGPNRSGSRLVLPIRPMLSLYLNTPPQAQLETLPILPDYPSGSSSFVLLEMFNFARLDPFGRLVCSCGLPQLPC